MADALQRYPRLDDRSTRAALSQGAGKEAWSLLNGSCGDGELQGLVVHAYSTEADGHAERILALHRIEPRACAMIVSAAGPYRSR
jgi:hypothetical protein